MILSSMGINSTRRGNFGSVPYQRLLYEAARRRARLSGSFCRTLPMSAQASSLRRFLRSSTVKSLPPVVRDSRSQVTGAETGAPGRARDE
jgi:hypothetical protein